MKKKKKGMYPQAWERLTNFKYKMEISPFKQDYHIFQDCEEWAIFDALYDNFDTVSKKILEVDKVEEVEMYRKGYNDYPTLIVKMV